MLASLLPFQNVQFRTFDRSCNHVYVAQVMRIDRYMFTGGGGLKHWSNAYNANFGNVWLYFHVTK